LSEAPENARAAAPLIWAALLVVYLVWGSAYLAIAVTVETLPPLLSGGLRNAAAGLVLAIILMACGRDLRLPWRQVGAAAVVGITLITSGTGLVTLAQSSVLGRPVPSGITALLMAAVPLLLVVLRVVHADRPTPVALAGVLLGLAGLVMLIIVQGGAGGVVPAGGALLVVLSTVGWALGSYYSTRLPLPSDPFVGTAYQMLIGGALLAGLGVGAGELAGFDVGAVSTRSWLAFTYLAVAACLVAYTAYVWLLGTAPISLTSTYAYVNPVVAVVLGALLLDERLTGDVVLAGAVIVVGVALVVRTERDVRRVTGIYTKR
jgi:drug/metabolite transporter (DMT)-like permease